MGNHIIEIVIGIKDESHTLCISEKTERTYLVNFVIFVIIMFLIILVLSNNALAGKQPYPEHLNRIAHEVREILIKHGLPVKHDRENPWFYISASSENYIIYFYQTDEIPMTAKMETIKYVMDLYEEMGRKERFRIKMYYEKFEDERHLFSGIKPFYELSIGRN